MNSTAIPARALALVLAASLLWGGCRSSFDKIREEHRAVLEPKLGQLERIGKLLELTPPLNVDSESLSLPRSTALPASALGVRGMAAHVSLMYGEALADLTSHGPTASRVSGSNLLTTCASLLRKGTCPLSDNYGECRCNHSTAESLFERCEQIEYVFIVRTLEYGGPAPLRNTTPDAGPPDARRDVGPDGRRAPELGPAEATRADRGAGASHRDAGYRDHRGRPKLDPDQRVQSWSFRPGLLRAEVHLFELASGRRLGGFRVRVESDPTYRRSIAHALPFTRAHTQFTVDAEFSAACQQKIEAEIRRRAPAAYR